MPAITSKVLAAIAGVLTGLGGFILACQAMTLALIDRLGVVEGLTAAALILAVLAVFAFWFVRRASTAASEEASEVKSAAAGVVSALPGEALAALIRKHPFVASAAAVAIGFTLVRDPKQALRQAQSVLFGLL